MHAEVVLWIAIGLHNVIWPYIIYTSMKDIDKKGFTKRVFTSAAFPAYCKHSHKLCMPHNTSQKKNGYKNFRGDLISPV